MKTAIRNLDEWTSDELLAEVLNRSARDRPALDRIQVTTMRALLDNCDQKADLQPALERVSFLSIGQNNDSQ